MNILTLINKRITELFTLQNLDIKVMEDNDLYNDCCTYNYCPECYEWLDCDDYDSQSCKCGWSKVNEENKKSVMNNKQLQFVNYKQAKRLKNLGFDWKTDYHYSQTGLLALNTHTPCQNWNEMITHFSAPAVAIALKWFRDIHEFYTSITFFFDEISCQTLYEIVFLTKKGKMDGSVGFESYEVAESALLDELLTILEK